MTAPAGRFAYDDDAAHQWLAVLRDGDDQQKIQARQRLATIFARRGIVTEAIELLEANLQHGNEAPSTYEAFGRRYAAQGRPDRSISARIAAQRLREPLTTLRRPASWQESVATICLLLLLCWPIGFMLMWRYSFWSRPTKIAATAAVVTLTIVGLAVRGLHRTVDG
jgi:hypothetical protein